MGDMRDVEARVEEPAECAKEPDAVEWIVGAARSAGARGSRGAPRRTPRGRSWSRAWSHLGRD